MDGTEITHIIVDVRQERRLMLQGWDFGFAVSKVKPLDSDERIPSLLRTTVRNLGTAPGALHCRQWVQKTNDPVDPGSTA